MLPLCEYLEIARRTVLRHAPRGYRQALLRSDATDLAVRRMLEMESKYDPSRGMRRSSWRVYVARNALREFIREGRDRRVVAEPLGDVDVADPRLREPVDAMIAREESQESADYLAGLLGCLSPRQRACVSMRHLDGLPAAEIARRCGCSPQSVRQMVDRGLRRMRGAG